MNILLSTIHTQSPSTPLALLYLKAVLLNDKSWQEKIRVVIREFRIVRSLDLFSHRKFLDFLCQETKLKFLDIMELWVDWVGDDKFFFTYQDAQVVGNTIRGFMQDLCKKNNLDFRFYDQLVRKELIFSIDSTQSRNLGVQQNGLSTNTSYVYNSN